jgi:hypothetical protein
MNFQNTGKWFNFKNKFWVVQITKWDYEGAGETYGIICQYETKTDHAGLQLRLDFWQFMFNFQVYDNRHWDDKNDCWECETADPNSEEALKAEAKCWLKIAKEETKLWQEANI